MSFTKRLNAAERRKEIMDAAAKIIALKGLEKTTMEEIIAGTKLSKGGVYHYYRSVIEIFKDIMLEGIKYRNEIIKNHLGDSNKNVSKEFICEEIISKMIDDNPYTSLYVEFLIAKKRNKELDNLMVELKEQTKESLKVFMDNEPNWLSDPDLFQFISNFINAFILASNILDARDNFINKKELLKKMIICILENGEEQI